MCEIQKIPKIHDYNRDKMGIIQNEVVWNQNTGAGIAKFSLWLRNFYNPCEIFAMHRENPATLPCLPHCLLHPFQPSFHQFHLTFLHFGLMKPPRIHNIRHQYEDMIGMMAEVPKTCKTIRNNLETKSVVLLGPVHINWLNSYD